jgi:hypothetical protein
MTGRRSAASLPETFEIAGKFVKTAQSHREATTLNQRAMTSSHHAMTLIRLTTALHDDAMALCQ